MADSGQNAGDVSEIHSVATQAQYSTISTLTHSITLGPLRFEHADLQKTKALVLALIGDPNRKSVLVGYVNPHVFNLACSNRDVFAFVKQCRLCCIDGIGVQLAALAIRRVKTTRIVAEELFNAIAWDASFHCNAVLIGVTNDELMRATEAINRGSPSINIVDGIDGFQNDNGYKQWFDRLANADVVLIGAGSPRSEQIALMAHQSCHNAVIWHIGAGTIKTWAGTKRRAPGWVSRLGIQWLHRMCFEPHTRSRYTSGAIRFIKNLAITANPDNSGKSS